MAACMMKQRESPYLISATPMPSMSRLGLCSSFSCTDGREEEISTSKAVTVGCESARASTFRRTVCRFVPDQPPTKCAVCGTVHHSEMIIFDLLLGSDITASHNQHEEFRDK